MGYYDEPSVCKCGKHNSRLRSSQDGWDCSYVTAVELNTYAVANDWYKIWGFWPDFVVEPPLPGLSQVSQGVTNGAICATPEPKKPMKSMK